jgi:solute carrier family 35 protein
MHVQLPSRTILCVVGLITLGALVAGAGDLSFDPYGTRACACGLYKCLLCCVRCVTSAGYSFGLLSCIAQSFYLVLVSRHGKETTELVYYCALLAIAPATIAAYAIGKQRNAQREARTQRGLIITGEFTIALHYTHATALGFWFALFTAIATGSLLNYTMFLCTAQNSPLTTTIVGHIKNVITALVGMTWFAAGAEFSTTNLIGIFINLIGGVAYSYVKYRESFQPKSKPHE